MVLFRFWNMFLFSDENECTAPTYWLSLKFLSSLSITKAWPKGLSKNVCMYAQIRDMWITSGEISAFLTHSSINRSAQAALRATVQLRDN